MSDVISSHKKNWGRRWKVTVKNLRIAEVQGSGVTPFFYTEVITFEQKTWTPEGLHIKFDCTQAFWQWAWYADITIYNLNSPTSQNMIKYGQTCVVEAGYMDGNYGTVFEGTIFQPSWEKQNGVDWVLTLHCVVGIPEILGNMINHTVAGGITQRELVSEMVTKGANFPLALNLGEFPDRPRLTRATTFYGQAHDFLQYMADTNDMLLWFSHLQANMFQLEQQDTAPEWEYDTTNGLIGTPQQTQNGVEMKVLLNPDIHILEQVKLSQDVAIRQLTRKIGNFATLLTEDYRYIVGSVRHIGDTRGNEWYSEITAFFNTAQLLSLIRGI